MNDALSVLRARRAAELDSPRQRRLWRCWNAAALLLSSAFLCALCLSFAVGVYDWGPFFGYFRHPLIFLLNWLPVLLLQGLLYALFNRQWAAFLGSAAVFLFASLGNYFKLKFRDEPFTFHDMSSIRAGLSVAGDYGVGLSTRIALAFALVLLGALTLLLLARGRSRTSARLIGGALALLSLFPLWKGVYSDGELYYRLAEENLLIETWDAKQYFIATGFPYPFLYSITESRDIPPEGYDAAEAAALLAGYGPGEIPEERKVNLLVLQLESFTDLEAMGLTGVDPSVYAPLRALQGECLCGTLVANVIGGGTIDTERCFLSGSYGLQNYREAAPSYVRDLGEAGYFTTGGHPNRSFFYNRRNVAEYLGFEEYLFTDNYYDAVTGGEWRCDKSFLPEVFRQFRELSRAEAPVFSFQVTLQGHGPYNSESYDEDGHFWPGTGVSDTTSFVVNNYLSMIAETQRLLLPQLESLRAEPEPMVVLLYGDHNPRLENEEVYRELGLSFDLSTEKGFLDYYGTPWLLWANDAAKEQLGRDFSGRGPTVSPGYLMNVLYRELGWTGSPFMQFTDTVMERLPVVTTNGYLIENGRLTTEPSEEGRELLHQYECVQFYLRGSLR